MFTPRQDFSLRKLFPSKRLKPYKSFQKSLLESIILNSIKYKPQNKKKIEEEKNNQIQNTDDSKINTVKTNEQIIKEENNLENKLTKISSKELPKHSKTYKHSFVTSNNNYLNVHRTYTTNDTDEYDLINLINEDVSKGNKFGWELSVNSKEAKVYSKKTKLKNGDNSIITKTFATFPYSIDIIIQYLEDFEFRKKHEMMMKKGKSIEKIPQEVNLQKEYLYLYLKMPLMISDRDFVEEKKLWINHGNKEKTALFLLKSVERDDFPVNKGIVRGEMIINGNYLKEVEKNKTEMIMVCEMDIKMNIGLANNLMAKEAPKGQREWVKDTLQRLPGYIKEKGIVIH